MVTKLQTRSTNTYYLRYALILLLFTGVLVSFSQDRSIEGLIKDINQEVLAGATVKLLTATDTSLVKGDVTNAEGRYQLSRLPKGVYILVVSYLGFQNQRLPLNLMDEQRLHWKLPVIVLMSDQGRLLNEVVIVAKRPLIEQDIDKTIVNVESMTGSSGNNSLEILEKTPGVMLNEDGSINLNGKNNVLVLIDNRPTYMSGQDLAAYLKSLPASILDKLELIDNPPARYDASGGAIINIVLKKNRLLGYTGNINSSISQGKTTRHSQWAHINHKGPKINWFANGGFNRGANYYDVFQDRTIYNTQYEKMINTKIISENDFKNTATFGRLGLDYTINSQTIIGLVVNKQYIPRQETNEVESSYYTFGNHTLRQYVSRSDARFVWVNRNMNLNFQQKYKNKSELNADINLVNYTNEGSQGFDNFERSLSNHELFRYHIDNDFLIYSLKADYNLPLKNRATLEMGIKSSIMVYDNDSRHIDAALDNEVFNPGRSNHFLYDENINAGYIGYRKAINRVTFQLGLRGENTNFKGNLLANAVVNGTIFDQDYINLFPSAFITTKLDSSGNNNLAISYSKRINRPGYHQFNPFLNYVDQFSVATGNPSLLPAYFHNLELSYRFKQFLNLRAGYSYASGIVVRTSQIIAETVIQKPYNLGFEKIYTLSVSFNFNATTWWLMNYNGQLYSFHNRGKFEFTNINSSSSGARIRLFNQFILHKKWTSDLSFNFIGREFTEQTLFKPRFHFYGGIQLKLFEGKGGLKLELEDIFYTQKRQGNLVGLEQTTLFRTSEFDSRRVGISFSFRFGNEKFLRKRNNSQNEPESNRIGQ